MDIPVKPRLEPVSLETADAPTRELLDSMPPQARTMNVFRTFAHHPDLMRSWLGFGAYLLRSSTLEPRLRELVVLRVGWLCRSPYEWGQHVNLGRRSGVLEIDLERLTRGPGADGWSVAEAAALRATDQLIERHTLDAATWADLTAHFATRQVLDLIFLVGQYQLVAGALNALRVERDDGLDASDLPFPSPAE
jgi:4-carboxymuconolactone decarboxylase